MNLYWPGPKTIKFVWYPIGVIKLAEAPKHIAIRKALVGSTAAAKSVDWKCSDNKIAKVDKIIARDKKGNIFDTNVQSTGISQTPGSELYTSDNNGDEC